MAGSKRRRKSTPQYTGSIEKVVRKLLEFSSTSSDSSLLQWTEETAVLQVTQSKSSSTTTSSTTEGKVYKDAAQDTAGFWLLLATRTLEQLCADCTESGTTNTTGTASSTGGAHHASYQQQAWLSFALSQLCIPSESSSWWASHPVRQLLGRACIAAAMGALQALANLTATSSSTSSGPSDQQANSMAVLAAILALDQTVHQIPMASSATEKTTTAAAAAKAGASSGTTATTTAASTTTPASNTTKGPSYVINQVWLQARAPLMTHVRVFLDSHEFPSNTFWNESLETAFACLAVTRRNASTMIETFQQGNDHYTIYDYSVPSRWLPVALTTYGHVQRHLLPAIKTILETDGMQEHWDIVLDLSNMDDKTASTTASTQEEQQQDTKPAAIKTRKRKAAASADASVPSTLAAASSKKTVSGAVVRINLVSRLVRILTSVTNIRMERGFSGGTPLRNYMEACWADGKKKKKKVKLPDLRDSVTILLYHLVYGHVSSLPDCASTNTSSAGTAWVNETPDWTVCYPYLPDSIGQFAQFVVASLPTSYDEQATIRGQMEAVAAAYLLQAQRQEPEKKTLDARCHHFCLLQFHSALQQGGTATLPGGDSLEPIPVPALPTRRRNKKLYALTPVEDRLALLLRGLLGASSTLSSNQYWPTLVDWLEKAYDTRNTNGEVVALPSPVISTVAVSSSDRVATKKKTKRGQKRRKTADSTANEPYRRMGDARATLAAAIWDAISLSFRLEAFRAQLDVDVIYRMMAVNIQLILPPSREVSTRTESQSYFQADDCFLPHERTLWASHMNASICLGRGRLAYIQSDNKRTFFGDKRLDIFRRVAASTDSHNGWPLWLTPAHRLLVASNLSCETGPPESEQFIVDGAISSICHMLEKIVDMPKSNPDSTMEVINAFDAVQLSHENARLILTALVNLPGKAQHAAFSKLVRWVQGWIAGVKNRPADLERLSSDREAAGFVARVVVFCANAYSLLRFGPTIRSNLRDLLGSTQTSSGCFMRVSPSYCAEKCFLGVLGNWEYADDVSSPILLERVEKSVEHKLQHMLEQAFLLGFSTISCDDGHLLFSSWNSLGKSDVWSLTKSITPLKGDFRKKVPSLLLELRNELCFVHRIMCRANSRAVPKSPLYVAIESLESPSPHKSSRIWALEGSNYIVAMVKKAGNLIQKATQLFVADDDDETMSDEFGNDLPELLSLLQMLSTYISFAVSSLTRPQVDFFSSTYTTIFEQSNSNKRARGYSTESDNTASDAEDSCDSQDYAFSTFERLQDVCERTGGVPSHPDWLDKDTHLVDGVTYDIAVETALQAQGSLTNLLRVAIRQAKTHQQRALSSTCTTVSKEEMETSTGIAVELCWLQNFRYLETSTEGIVADQNKTDIVGDVSLLCQVESSVVGCLMDETTARNDDFRTRHWCTSASQRVQGRLHKLFRSGVLGDDSLAGPELRAADEWEILLARCLTPASICGSQGVNVRKDVDSSAANAERWLAVMWGIIESLTPVTALLRFGLSRKGRHTHPLRSYDASVDDFKPAESIPTERLPPGTKIVPAAQASVLETLALLALIPGAESISLAASIHLVPVISSFSTLQGVATCRAAIDTLNKISSLVKARALNDRKGVKEVVDRLVRVIESSGLELPKAGIGISQYPLLFTALDVVGFKGIETLVTPEVKFSDFWHSIDSCLLKRVVGPDVSLYKHCLFDGVASFVFQQTPVPASDGSRAFLIKVIATGIKIDFERLELKSRQRSEFLQCASGLLDECDNKALVRLVNLCCQLETDGHVPGHTWKTDTRAGLCYIFTVLVATTGPRAFTRSDLVANTLLESYSSWKTLVWTDRLPILNLLLVHATAAKKLGLVGSQLAQSAQAEEADKLDYSVDVENFSQFCRFVAALRFPPRFDQRSSDIGEPPMLSGSTVCSYKTKHDFYEQHWYQCFTCGLTGDRGCCTMCALVCHSGHDLAYARFSSFFCDCGAEEDTREFSKRIKCQCLSPLPSSEVRQLWKEYRSDGENSFRNRLWEARPLSPIDCAQLIVLSHEQESRTAVDDFLKIAQRSGWMKLLFKCMGASLQHWKSNANSLVSSRSLESYTKFGKLLCRRDALCKQYTRIPEEQSPKSYVFGDGSLQATLSNVQRTYLADRMIHRQVLDTDSRGRLIIGENRSLLFCNGAALVRNGNDSPRSRPSLCILKSLQIYFEILGVQLARANGRSLAVWGSREITILEMNSLLCSCEKQFDISVDLKVAKQTSNTILRCQWLPGSSTCFAVACRGAILVYDFSISEKTPVVTVQVGGDSDDYIPEFRDFAFVRVAETNISSLGVEKSWKAFLLLSDGGLHAVSLRYAIDGELFASKTTLLSNDYIRLPASAGFGISAHSKYLRRGKYLSYLEQSSVLVYQVPDEYSFGLIVGSDGEIDTTFVMLSQVLVPGDDSAQNLSLGCIKGPFTHWRELGLIGDEQEVYFRVTCFGRSSSTSHPVMLRIDFNESGSTVKIIQFENEDALRSPSLLSIDGCATFSTPVRRTENAEDGGIDTFVEQVFTCLITSKGAFHIHCEDAFVPTMPSIYPDIHREEPYCPQTGQTTLFAFESMTKIMSSVDVFFLGVGLESSEQTKTKLLRDNDMFLRSPEADGFTLNISLKDHSVSQKRDFVIAGVRLHFGATSPDSIPKYVNVHGTRVDLIAGADRWYSFPFTDGDILSGIRSEIFSIHISRTIDGTTRPIIDGMEVYGKERQKMQWWLPTSLQSIVARRNISSDNPVGGLTPSSRLQLVMNAIKSLNIVLQQGRLPEQHVLLLKEVVQETTLETDRGLAITSQQLVTSFGPAISEHRSFLDSAAISGCAQFLTRCCKVVEKMKTLEEYLQCWEYLRPPFRACMAVASEIARQRPSNYLKAVSNCLESVAVRASVLVDNNFIESALNGDVISDFVELSLLESAVARGFGADFDSRGRAAGFDILHRLLISPNELVVKRSCAAIRQFCEKYSTADFLAPMEVDLFATQPMVVYYGCDGCGLCPITNVRYSLKDVEHPLDLCSECYHIAFDFAASHSFSDVTHVEIKQRTVGEGTNLTCAEVKDLEAVTIPTKSTSTDGTSATSAKDLTESRSSNNLDSSEAQIFPRQQLFDDFTDALFSTIVNLIASELDNQELSVCALVSLVCESSHFAQGRNTDRSARLCRKIVEGLSRVIQRVLTQPRDDSHGLETLESSVIRFLTALSSIVIPDTAAREYIINPDDECEQLPAPLGSPPDKIQCDHGIVATRRKFSKGSHKGHTFCCCSVKSKAHRCNFFLWIDGDKQERRPLFNENISDLIWKLLSHSQSKDSLPLHLSLCNLVSKSLLRLGGKTDGHRSVLFHNDQIRADAQQLVKGSADGIHCSIARLYTMLQSQHFSNEAVQCSVGPAALLSATFKLMALVAGPEATGVSDWFSPLCRVLLSGENNVSSLRPQAKRSLWLLVGKNSAAYLDIRDEYLFQVQFDKLTLAASSLRDYCLLVNKKAMQQKRQVVDISTRLDWESLELKRIVGAVDLMSENASLRSQEKIAEQALTELLSVASKRHCNWKTFCTSKVGKKACTEKQGDHPRMPILELLHIASLMSGDNQAKAMKLASLALPPFVSKTKSTVLAELGPGNQSVEGREERCVENVNSTIRGETDGGGWEELSLDLDDLYAFVLRFVCGDESHDIRRLASKVVAGLSNEKGLSGQLFSRLLTDRMPLLGRMGKMYSEFLSFMVTLALASNLETIDAKSAASAVEVLFRKQVISAVCEFSNGNSFHFETRTGSSIQKNRFDLNKCAHIVLRPPASTTRNIPQPSSKSKRLLEQVSPYGRIRLETGSDTSSSNEFNYFLAVSHRCVVSEVHVEICDPRGRFVKTINFYVSPRPVDNPKTLKADTYMDQWQKCGSWELGKGVEKSTFTLDKPVVAANVRVEFSEFYDRPGSAKSDGFVVHCPRCTRIVTNAHGVCGSCGEVAFQCRKCRHINYDRLDAYLCVECGYCASGSLSFELTAGVASNAVAITSERDFKQATHMLLASKTLFEEIQSALRRRLQTIAAERSAGKGMELLEHTDLQRAYEGRLPLQPGTTDEKTDPVPALLKRFNKRGSIVRAVAQKRHQDRSQRQPERGAIRHIRGDHNDDDDEDGDDDDDDEASASELLGGLLESAGVARGLDPSDPVSRLLATVQRQRERTARLQQEQAQKDSTTKTSKGGLFDECERLYRLMHEAQRECFALERRIRAWLRLESGNLVFAPESRVFEPSYCSICSNGATHQLLQLWHALFLLDPKQVTITKDMLAILLQDDQLHHSLPETKRETVKDIALRANEVGRSMVLEGLSLRLRTLQDAHCAEILGMILKAATDSAAIGHFLALARESMESSLSM